ncbi:Phosphatidylethanolamine N-methyltransferase [Smittium culicis]|uniref:Phosphatidylethanolamine N-methyltransferase n=1 Tax=Smittium culicis TaxID=133412 RepID=A0A1R1WZS7_9FUNG|nr:Phosphatidylethanolamine N-methyltransferase [Smittium culicis]
MLRSRKKAEPNVSNRIQSKNEAETNSKKDSDSHNEDEFDVLIGCTPSGDGFSFAFWRISYNVGLGYLLRWQSQRQGLVTLWKKYVIKQKGKEGKLGKWIRAQLEAKMGPDYDFYVK